MTKILREELGDALHHVAHPGHPWSGCPYPEKWYEVQPGFLATLEKAGYALTECEPATTSANGTYVEKEER